METRIAALGDFNQGQTKRTTTGVAWLNEHLGGGLSPSDRIWIHGGPGSGKTVLSMRIAAGSEFQRVLWHSAAEPGSSRRLLERLSSTPQREMAFTIREELGLAGLPEAIQSFGPDLIVIDQLDGVGDARGVDIDSRVFYVIDAIATMPVSVPLIMNGSSKSLKVQHAADMVIETLGVNGTARITKNRNGLTANGLTFAAS